MYAITFLFAQPAGAMAVGSQSERVDARIVADVQSIQPGTPFWLGVHFDVEEGWHLNWINPGDAGLAPSIRWKLPEGFEASELVWPYPRVYRVGPLAIYGYDGELLLTSRVEPPAELPASGRVEIGADVDWLACAEACVPGRAALTKAMTVKTSRPMPDDRWQRAFEEARRAQPAPSAKWRVQAFVEEEERILLEVRSNDPEEVEITECRFFPLEPDLIAHAQPQRFTARYGGFDLMVERARMSTEVPDRVGGVLVADPGWDRSGKRRAISFDVPLVPR